MANKLIDLNGIKAFLNKAKALFMPKTGGTFTGQVTSTWADALRMKFGDYGVILRNDGNFFYILLTNKGNSGGNFNDLRPFAIFLQNGGVVMQTPVNVENTLTATQVVQSSDEKLKDVTGEAGLTIGQVAAAPAVKFNWRDGSGRGVGSTAQYWKGVLPDAVTGEEGSMAMDYGAIALVSAITAAREIEALKERVAALEEKLKPTGENQAATVS